MLKKIALIVLFGMNNLQASDALEVHFIDKIRNNPHISMWMGAIIPSIFSGLFFKLVSKIYKDNPEKKHIVTVAKGMEWVCAFVAMYFFDDWFMSWTRTWKGYFNDFGYIAALQRDR